MQLKKREGFIVSIPYRALFNGSAGRGGDGQTVLSDRQRELVGAVTMPRTRVCALCEESRASHSRL